MMRPELPTGTVTFLFTDVEGSTRLLQQLREGYADVLAAHARIIRSAIDEFGGHEIDTQGDSFFAAFPRARDAVGAAVAIQRALSAEPWPDGASVRVRMGIHTGEPLVGGERYVGMGVNRGARICAAGHGGQVLLSNTTRELVEDDLPSDVRVVDLGEHELKDVRRPERIFQLEIDGLPLSFPPLRTVQVSAYEGREDELARAAQRISWRRFRTRRVALLAIAGAALVAAAVVGLITLGGSSPPTVAANSVVALDPSGSIAKSAPVGARPVALTSAAGSLWVANLDDRLVSRVDPTSGRTVRSFAVAGAPTALASTPNGIWVAHGSRKLSRIDSRYDRLTATRSVAESSAFFYGAAWTWPLVAAFGSVWIVSPDGVVLRIDPSSGRRTGSIGVGTSPSAIAAGADSIWVTNRPDGTVSRIDARTLIAKTIPVGHGPSGIAINDAGVWVANAGDNALVRIDPETNAVASTTPVGDGPTAVHATPDAVWVANALEGTVMRVDPDSGDVTKTTRVGGTPNAIASLGGQVWVAVAPAPPPPAEAGGVARLVLEEDFPSLDPGLGLAAQLHFATCVHLVTYPDGPAPEGSRIVPEVAEAVPTPTDGGTTYTFTIRPGFRFSPPSDEPVTAQTFKSTIERVASPRMKSPIGLVFSGIFGYREYVSGKASGISGLVARRRTLTVRLARPNGGFMAALADGAACAVPSDTPVDPDGIDTIPAAGPYYIASYTPRRQIVLRRNPNYHGNRPRNLEEIVVAIGVDSARALREIEAGEADWAFFGPPPAAGPMLEQQYGARSAAAKGGHQQYFVSEANGARFLHMNTTRRPFSDPRMRRAVNYAIDRRALVAQGRRFAQVNPFNAGRPTDDYLPPSIAGAADFHVYPLKGPDLRRAKQFAGRHGRARAVMYTPNFSPWREEAQVVQRNLRRLAIDVEVKEFAIGDFFTRLSRPGEPFDLAVSGWWFGTTDPARMLEIFSGGTIGPTQSSNFSYFDDPAVNRKLEALARLSGAKRYREYNRLALALERDHAPAAAFAVTESRDFFSARIGCQVYHPVFGVDIAALCLRE